MRESSQKRNHVPSLFPLLPDVANVKGDLYLWGAAFAGVLLAIFVFTTMAPLVFGGHEPGDSDQGEGSDDEDDDD